MGKEQNTLAYTLKRCKKYNNDTFQMFAKGCNYCSKYGNGKIYSISGTSDKYPSMMTIPEDLVIGRCPHCDRAISFGVHFPELEDLDKPLSSSEVKQLERQRGKTMANNSLITLNCPNCGSQLEVNSIEMKTNCKYCGTQILIKDFITERRIDKNDKIKALEDLVNNAANNGDYAKAYKYSEDICKLDSSNENLVKMNLFGFMAGKIEFNSSLLDDLYSFSPDEHRSYLSRILGAVNTRKQNELDKALKIANEQRRRTEAAQINNKYTPVIFQINTEINKMKQKRCKCGHMLEYNENVCPNCGMNYGDYQTELTRIKKEKNKKMVKLGIIIGVPIVIAIVVFAFVYNANLVNNINTAIDSKNYSKAEQLIDGYQEANPTRTDVYELYADLYLAENNPEKAIEKLEEGIRRVSSSGKKDLQNKIDAIKQEYNLE